jgi:hypothetical protein
MTSSTKAVFADRLFRFYGVTIQHGQAQNPTAK